MADDASQIRYNNFDSKPFQSRNSRLSQAGRTAEPFQIEADAELFKELGSAHEKFGV